MAIGRYVDPKRYKRAKANERDVADVSADVAKLIADMPLLPQSALADKARIEALRLEVKNISLPSFTPDAARYGDLQMRLSTAEVDITDLEADVAALITGDSILALTTLPLIGKVGGIDKRLGEAEEDIADLDAAVAALSAGDSILAYTALPDKAAISALREEMKGIVPAWATPDAARYGSVTVQLAELEEGLADAVADIAALTTGDSILAHTALPDKARIEALRQEVRNQLPAFATPDAARYGSVTIQLAELEEGLADVVATVASVTAGDSLLSHTASPDKARIEALRAEVRNITPAWLTPDMGRYGALQYDVSYLTSVYNGLAAGAAIMAQDIVEVDRTVASLQSLPAKVAALRADIDRPTLFDLTPDAARYGDVQARLVTAEKDITDLESDVAAITAGDPLLAYTALPDKARISALSEEVAGLAEDVAGLAVSDPLLAFTALPDKARIEAVKRELQQNTMLSFTPDAARYGDLTLRMGTVEEEVIDLASEIAAIAIGDPLLAYSALPDKSAIAALREEVRNIAPAWTTPDIGRYGALQYDVSALTVNITSLSTTAAVQAQQITALDRTVASLHPLRAQIGSLVTRVGSVEEDVVDLAADVAAIVVGDPLLSYSALPDKAAIAALRERVTVTEEDIIDLAADVAAVTVTDPILAYTELPGAARYAHLGVQVEEAIAGIAAVSEELATLAETSAAFAPGIATAQTSANAARRLVDELNTLVTAYFAYFGVLVPLISDVASMSIPAMTAPARIQYLMEEVNQLRVEMSAFYSDRAKLAHLENRLADMEKLSWL